MSYNIPKASPYNNVKLSIIIPVYNRPDELDELLSSLCNQTYYHQDYEIIVIEDGSTLSSEQIVNRYGYTLRNLRYIEIPNGGPSKARNIGAREARGEYLIILDSDVVLPEKYIEEVIRGLERTDADAFGGPDAAAPHFTPMQHAISYAMTSIFTTGGIRGGSAKAMERFKPRTFNMGVRRQLFERLGGFSEDMRYGEDIDFSLRMLKAGAKVELLPEAFVYHKRRVNLEQFFQQVRHSGQARIELEKRHPESLRLVHLLPTAFLIVLLLAIVSTTICYIVVLYALLLFVDACSKTKSIAIALRAVVASFVMLIGYGIGFIEAKIRP